MKTNPYVREGRAVVGVVQAGDQFKESVAAVMASIGGFSPVVGRGDTVLLKPNFNSADPPPASSDPAFVGAVIELLYDHGVTKVIVGESSHVSTRQVLTQTGMLDIARKTGAEVVIFDEGEWISTEVGGRYLKKTNLAAAALRAEKIIFLPCLKTHFGARFTCSLKLLVGCVRPQDRGELHGNALQEKVAELNTIIHSDLVIMDARKCFITGGPSQGETREPGLILASGDRVAIDAEGVKIIQGYPGNSLSKKEAWDFPQLRWAIQLGLGQRDAHLVVGPGVPA